MALGTWELDDKRKNQVIVLYTKHLSNALFFIYNPIYIDVIIYIYTYYICIIFISRKSKGQERCPINKSIKEKS